MGASSGSERPPAFDRAALLDHLGGDADMLRELLLLYAEEGPRLTADLHAAVEAGDADGVRRTAHALKGTLGSLTAQQASTSAELLETLARAGRLERAASALADLDIQLQRLDAAVQSCLAGGRQP